MKKHLTRGGAWLIAVITALALVMSVSLTQPSYAAEETTAETAVTTEVQTDLSDDAADAAEEDASVSETEESELLSNETLDAEEAESLESLDGEEQDLTGKEEGLVTTNEGTTEITEAAYTISANGTYHVASGLASAITISAGVTEVTIEGNGIEYNSDITSTDFATISSTANAITIDATAAPGINITLKDLYNSVKTNNANLLDFSGAGNVLTIKGIVLMDYDVGYTTAKDALIHVGPGTELTIKGDGKYYQYNNTQGAGIGGVTKEMNGTINFSMTGSAFIKGTKQGAVIGAGAGANGSGTPGPVTFNSGEYNIITNSRGAAIGGSAGSGGASSGTTVYVKGGTVSVNTDFSGAAVGGGGYDSGNDSSGGTLYMTGGSLRSYVDENAAKNVGWTGWKGRTVTSAGVSDIIITAERKNASGKDLYYCTVPAGEVDADESGEYTITVDDEDYYKGTLHRYTFAYDGVNREITWNTKPNSTIGNWILDTTDKKDTNAYLFLTGKDHKLMINGVEYKAIWKAASETFLVVDAATLVAPDIAAEAIYEGENAIFTFTDDEAWRTKVTEVKVGDTAVTDYTLENGKLTIPSANLASAGEYTITVQADGYTDAVGTITVKPMAAIEEVTVTAEGTETCTNAYVAVPTTFASSDADASCTKIVLKVNKFAGNRNGSFSKAVAGTDLPSDATVKYTWDSASNLYIVTATAAEGKTIPMNGELFNLCYFTGTENGGIKLEDVKFYNASGKEIVVDSTNYNDATIKVDSSKKFTYTLVYDSEYATLTPDKTEELAPYTVNLTCTNLKEGYAVKSITVKGVCTGEDVWKDFNDGIKFGVPKEDNCTVTVEFGKLYTVTVDNTKSVGGTITAAAAEFVESSTVKITSTPEEGYDSSGTLYYQIEGDDKIYETTGSIKMPEGNITVWKQFKKQYKVNVVQTTGGTATTNKSSVVESSYVTPGYSADVYFAVDANYSFNCMQYSTDGEKWTTVSQINSTSGTYSKYGRFTMPEGDVTVKVLFDPYATVKAAEGIEHGTLTFDNTTAAPNKLINITPKPEKGYRISKLWYEDEAGTKTELIRPSFNLPQTGNLTVYAEFVSENQVDETISSKEELIALAEAVNNGNTKYGKLIELTADIDLTDTDWTPIGKSAKIAFNGTFKGNNHTIKGIKITGSVSNAGLFGYAANCTIEDLVLYGDVEGTSYAGGLAGTLSGNVRNIKNYCNITANTYAGGIVGGFSGGTIENCLNYGTVTSKNNAAGGIAGNAYGTAVISECGNNGTVNSKAAAGGIVGYSYSGTPNVTISKCYNKGDVVTAGAMGSRVGGILGDGKAYSATFVINDCYNLGTLSAGSTATKRSGEPCVAGIMSIQNNPNYNNASIVITNCYNFGKLEKTGRYTGTTVNYGEIFPDKILVGNDYAGWTETEISDTYLTKTNCYKSTDDFTASDLGSAYKDSINEGITPVLTWEEETLDENSYKLSFDITPSDVECVITVANSKTPDAAIEAGEDGTYTLKNGIYNYKITVKDGDTCNAVEGTARIGSKDCVIKAAIPELTYHRAAEATCTQAGNIDYWTCDKCQKVYKDKYGKEETTLEDVTIAKLAHEFVISGAKEATCTEDGSTGEIKCSVCDYVYIKAQVIPKLGHNEVTDAAVEATCEHTGLSEGKHCTRCGEVTVAQQILDKLPHTIVEDAAVSATCGRSGLTAGSHCSVCKTVIVAQERVERLEHNLEMTGYKTPTCTQTGYTGNIVCTVCNRVVMKGSVIPMTNHVEVTDKGYAATCEENGLTDGKHCAVCGKVTVEQDVIPAPGHTEVTIPGYPATSEKTGLTDGIECSVCGKVIKAQEVIPKLVPDGWNLIDGKYYFYKDGVMQKGWISDIGRTYYTDPETGVMIEGFKKIDDNWFYFKTGGSGRMLTGFQKINGSWFYFDTTTGIMQTGLQTIGNGKYYFKGGDSGKMLTGFQKIDGNWYYFKTGDSGRMLTGFQKVNGYWYYMDPQTGIVQTGLKKIGSGWYYFKGGDSGRMLTGWQTINGKTYYFKTGDSGRALTGTQTIDGKTYTFDENGVLVK